MTKVRTEEEQIKIVEDQIRSLPVAGRSIFPKGKPSCILCHRAAVPSGRLLWPGAPTCSSSSCETCRAADVTEIFETIYGRAIDLWTLRTFLRCLDGPAVFVDRTVLFDRAHDLATALVRLRHWQWVFDSWTMVHRPESKELGRAVLVPPRRIDEVVRIRLKGEWMTTDPSETLQEPIRSQIREVWEKGPSVPEIPF